MRVSGLGASVILLLLAVAAGPAQAAATATQFIEQLGSRLVPILADDGRSDAAREEQLKDLVRDGFDLSITGRFVLGKYWRKANKAQQSEYERLFAQYVVTTTARRFAPFRDVTFKIVDSKQAGKQDMMIKTLLIRPDKEVPADWRVRKVDDRFRLIDVHVAGVSMAVTQRQDFAAVISARGIDGLLEDLRKQVGEPDRSAAATNR